MDYVFRSGKKSVFGSLEEVCPCLKERENNTAFLSSNRRNECMSVCVVFSLKMPGKLMDPLNAVSLYKNVNEQLN